MSARAGQHKLVGAALLTLLSGTLGAGQAEGQQPPHRAWVALGLGAGGRFDDGGGFGVMGEAVYERRPDHFALRGLGVGGSPEDRGPGFAEIGVLYGRFVSGDDAHASAAAGLSAVFLEECDDTHNECTTLGIPLKLEVALVPVPVVGIGLQVFGNLNPKQPYVGLFVMLPLGWMP